MIATHCAAALKQPATAPWRARLDLSYERRGARTLLVRRNHAGPLVVQKALYPEGDAPCQTVILHPPGGIAGGDELELSATVGPGAHVQLTTPGAAKWYRSAGMPARQAVTVRAEAGATVEWLPQETIVFDGAIASLRLSVDLGAAASFIGWDVVCLGRTAAGERFDHGSLRQTIELCADGDLVWTERARVEGGGGLLRSPAGLHGQPVFGTFVAMGEETDDATLDALRRLRARSGDVGVTRLDRVLLGRYRGDSAASARAYFIALWGTLRLRWLGIAAVPPRIWST